VGVAAVSAPDGVQLHVDVRGDGPLVVLAPGLWSPPQVYAPLLDDLATDHRVVTYDPRGAGRSGGDGPHDLATDLADLAAIVEANGGPATFVTIGAGSTLALHLANQRPELGRAVICAAGSPVNREVARGSESIAGSRSVFDLLSEMAQRDFRGFLRSIVTSTNPQLDESGVIDRVRLVADYTSHDAMLTRLQAWLGDDAVATSLAAGDRLTILLHGDDEWTSANAVPATRELLPDAEVLEVEDGPLSRPDITAAIVRRKTGVAA
jgi:pimeloyl-ACP methyl ester carboxylesterase